jgi:hypothetical protein
MAISKKIKAPHLDRAREMPPTACTVAIMVSHHDSSRGMIERVGNKD